MAPKAKAQAKPPGPIGRWIAALRPPTLLASITSIAAGALAFESPDQRVDFGWLALTFVALATLQIVANLVNDYGDYKKGADDESERLGPPRVIAMGWITPEEIKKAIDAILRFEVVLAVPLCLRGGIGVLCLGLIGVAGAIWYTTGKRSLAYMGLGEVAVFLLFGPGSVLGTVLVQSGGNMDFTLLCRVILPSFIAGSLVSAILVVNNLRDIPSDRKVNKETLATRLGPGWTRMMHSLMILSPYVCLLCSSQRMLNPSWRVAWATFPFALGATWAVHAREGRALNACLGVTALLGTTFCLAPWCLTMTRRRT
mmetsp:Transcript_28622/g.46531  ORF Transcript_28622/g.46531 Transcript_28622/m.46531 type:complete len:313 (+) Transcript_28622:62-1000(+)|eukprot:jgi/Bigna1/88737/estExt_fgenesh1_pg.C_370080